MNEIRQTTAQGRAMVDQGWATLRDAIGNCPRSRIVDLLGRLADVDSGRSEADRRTIDRLALLALHEGLVRLLENPGDDEEGGLS